MRKPKVVVFDSRAMDDPEKVRELIEATYFYYKIMHATFFRPVSQNEALPFFFEMEKKLKPFLGINDKPKGKAVWK